MAQPPLQANLRNEPAPAALPWIILAGCLLLTMAATLYVQRTTQAKDRERLDNTIQEVGDAIRDRMHAYVTMLRGGAGLFAAGPVTADRFKAYVERLNILQLYPGTQGMGYSQVVPADAKGFVEAMRAQGLKTRVDGSLQPFQLYPESVTGERHAIIYLQPVDDRNETAIGYDMFSEPVRRQAMEQARDQGRPVPTGRVTLVQEIRPEKQAGFLLYVPVYQGGVIPPTVEERRRLLRGFVYSPFRADDFVEGVFAARAHPLVAYTIYDGGEVNEETRLHRSKGWRDAAGRFPRLQRTVKLAVPETDGPRTWTLAFQTLPEFDRGSGTPLLPIIPVAGAAGSLALFWVTRAQVLARRQAERSAAELRTSEQALRASEARLRRLVDANLIGVAFCRLDGRITDANEAYFQMVGYGRDDLLSGRISWRDLTPPEYMDVDDRAVRQLREKGTCAPFEKEYRRADGRRVPVLVAMALLDRETGDCVALNVDLSERKAAEAERLMLLANEQHARREAEAAQKRLAFLADASGMLASSLEYEKTLEAVARLAVPYLADWCIVYSLEADGTIRRVAVVHDSLDEAQAQLAESLRQQRLLLEDAAPSVARAMGEGRSQLVESIPPNPPLDAIRDPAYRRLIQQAGLRSAMFAPLRARGKVVGALGFLMAESGRYYRQADVPFVDDLARRASVAVENALLYRSAQQSLAEAESASRLKDDFLATVSHELRTPLNAILGWAQLLAMGHPDEASVRQGLETIGRNARAQARLIDDLLDVSRIVSGKLKLEIRSVDLEGVIQAALDTVRPAAAARQVELRVELDPAARELPGDASRLQQVVWNLLTNAIKFTPKGGSVLISTRRAEDAIELKVTDTGEGIAPDFLPYVFTPFRQADASSTRRHGGLGLGLAIVRNLVELHGGTIRAQSGGVGAGASFIVELPVRRLPEAPPPVRAVPAERAGQAEPGASLQGVRILAVDDEADNLELMRRVLEGAGAEVAVASSADQAIGRLSDFSPDVLLSDIAMPGKDGYALLREARRQRAGMHALAVTAFARDEDRRTALAAGFEAHVAKPVEPEELVLAISRLCAR